MAKMSDETLSGIVFELVRDAEGYRDDLSADRIKAMEYFDGTMKDIPHDPNRSKVVSRDVRSAIKKILPSITRTILGNDKVVEYEPVSEGDEEMAEQATDYINYVVFPESDGYDAVQDAAHDALKLRNGIIRWWYDTKRVVTSSRHTGLDEIALTQLINDEEVEVISQEQYMQTIEDGMGQVQEIPLYNVEIKRTTMKGRTRLATVPLEEFLIHPDAISIEDSPIVGLNCRLRRSDLVAMGYDRDEIDKIPMVGEGVDTLETEEITRKKSSYTTNETTARALQEVEYYEVYVRIDADDDGIAELRRLCYAGSIKAEYLLDNEETDEIPFADLIIERRPHQREGGSITDDMMEIQQIKTVLLRQTLDNIYWQNNPQPIVQEGTIANPESVLNPKFGQPIRVNQGTDVRQAINFSEVRFVAANAFQMMEYLDQEASDRTGISDASSGMAPDALQNMTAKASAMIEQAGIGQTELMVRTFAQGLKRVFRGLLRLVIKHQDKPRMVRLRNKWVSFDPRAWNADMDATVNTGLGAGTRERDMLMTQYILQLQEKLLMALGPDNPFVKPDNLFNAVSKSVEAAGMKSPDLYFTKPDPEEIQRQLQAQGQKPDPEMAKVQAKIQADQMKAQADQQIAQQKLQGEMQLEQAKMQMQMQTEKEKAALERYKIDQEMQLKKYQVDQEVMLKGQINAIEIMSGERTNDVKIGGDPG